MRENSLRQIDCEDKIVCGMLNWNISSHRDGQRGQLGPWYLNFFF